MRKLILAIVLPVFLCTSSSIFACSMYKITKDGKTIVGNNEDYISPNGQFWFEQGVGDYNGAMYMGFLDGFIQGGINEKGLVFDGFWEPYLEVKNLEGKLNIPIKEALKKIMQSMERVEEVEQYLKTINLSVLENGQIVFVDKQGKYLIVEGDEMFTGNESEKTFSNFYYSQIKFIDDVNLEYFRKGREFINTTQDEVSLDYCANAMKNFSQSKIAPTQYSTIYDLDELVVRVYLYKDYDSFVELDLKKELSFGNHKTMIVDLFPKDSKGYLFYEKYNNTENPTLWLKEYIGDAVITEQEYIDYGFNNIINSLGFEWLYDIKNSSGAIKVFEYGLKLMPNNAKLYDSLGEAYYVKKEWNSAIEKYEKSLKLNPDNRNAIDMIDKIKKLQKQSIHIPFTLSDHNNIVVQAVLNSSDTLDLMLHTAATSLSIINDYSKNVQSIIWKQETEVNTWGGKGQSKYSVANSLEIGGIRFDSLAIWGNERSGPGTVGKFGLNLFEDYAVEIDFDNKVIVLHDELPELKYYSEFPFKNEDGLFFIDGTFNIDSFEYTQQFLLHSGYSGNILFDDKFTNDINLGDRIAITSEQELKDSFGNILKTKKGMLQQFNIGDFAFYDISVGFFEGKIGRQQMSVVGGDFISRFNIVIDKNRNNIYLSPNSKTVFELE